MEDTSKAVEEAEAGTSLLPQKESAHLLVVNTNDAYSTSNTIKKLVTKKRAAGLGSDLSLPASDPPGKLEEVLPGLQRIGKNPKKREAFFSFVSDETRGRAAEFLRLMKTKSHHWDVSFSSQAQQFKRSRKEVQASAKRQKCDTIHDICEPLHNMPYEEQLLRKRGNLERSLQSMRTTILDTYKEGKRPLWVSAPPVALDGVSPSPVVTGYRNKVEFTCGLDKEGNKAVGFLFGRFAEGAGWIEPPSGMKIISRAAAEVAEAYSTYMKASPEPVWDRVGHNGVFRSLVVREGKEMGKEADACLVDVQINDADGSVASKIKADLLKEEVFGKFLHDSSSPTKIASLQLTLNASLNNMCPEDAPTEVLYGPGRIDAKLCGMRFKVSARSFFQVNYSSNELLIERIRKLAELDEETVLFDLCCGTGSIGLCLAKNVKLVVGIDIVEAAIADARENARANGIENAEFHAGKCEEKLSVLAKHASTAKKVVAIVDPPRCGLHKDILGFLRNCKQIENLVYVSCNQDSLCSADCKVLCRPVSNSSVLRPFIPREATGVDLFPHCDQQELIVRFSRETDRDLAGGEQEEKEEGKEKQEAQPHPGGENPDK